VREKVPLHSLEAELVLQTLADAAASASVIAGEAYSQANPSAREVVSVVRLVGGSDAARVLQPATSCWRFDGSR